MNEENGGKKGWFLDNLFTLHGQHTFSHGLLEGTQLCLLATKQILLKYFVPTHIVATPVSYHQYFHIFPKDIPPSHFCFLPPERVWDNRQMGTKAHGDDFEQFIYSSLRRSGLCILVLWRVQVSFLSMVVILCQFFVCVRQGFSYPDHCKKATFENICR